MAFFFSVCVFLFYFIYYLCDVSLWFVFLVVISFFVSCFVVYFLYLQKLFSVIYVYTYIYFIYI